MRVIRIWLNSDDSVNIVTDISSSDINKCVVEYGIHQQAKTEITLERYLSRAFGKNITIIPRDVEDNEVIMNH